MAAVPFGYLPNDRQIRHRTFNFPTHGSLKVGNPLGMFRLHTGAAIAHSDADRFETRALEPVGCHLDLGRAAVAGKFKRLAMRL